MKENFEYGFSTFAYSPYQMWLQNVKTKNGDCNDYSCFAVFCANWHGYETYQIAIIFKASLIGHFLAVYREYDKYTYSSNEKYYPIYADTFEECVLNYLSFCKKDLNYYKVYDYNMRIIEKGMM